jgi:hypothetical protein
MSKCMTTFERLVFSALAVVTTTTIGILLHATFNMASVA